jgi:pilus assembly protein CpaE
MAIHVHFASDLDRPTADLLRGTGVKVSQSPLVELQTLATSAWKAPDVLLLDLRGRSSLPAALATIRRLHPAMGVVLLATGLDPALLLDAMRAGVSEVVTEPLTAANLMNGIKRVAGERLPVEVGHAFAFVGAKGGVGTTTVAVNVAMALAMSVKGSSEVDRVLIIDLHPVGGDVALFTGVEPRFSVLDVFENMHRLDRSLFKTLVSEVAPRTDVLASTDAGAISFDRERVQRLLAFAAETYRFVVVDMPRSEPVILDALDQMTTIFIVANQELATVKSAGRLAGRLRERYGSEKVRTVLSRSDREADIGRADVEKAVRSAVTHTFPSDYRLALHALNAGRPVVLDNHNELSTSFKRFAASLSGPARETAQPKSAGLIGRLMSVRK